MKARPAKIPVFKRAELPRRARDRLNDSGPWYPRDPNSGPASHPELFIEIDGEIYGILHGVDAARWDEEINRWQWVNRDLLWFLDLL